MQGYFFYLFIAGYLIGSIPFAYLLTKRKHGLDIRTLGSGNVGARNAFEVTSDKSIGTWVLALDLLKGLLPTLFLLMTSKQSDGLPWLVLGLVAGHCYPVWLKFHGGRGLATAGGILLLLSPVALVLWLAAYYLSSKVRSQVHLNAMIALLVVALATVSAPDTIIPRLNPFFRVDASTVREGVLFLFVVLFSRHIGPVWKYARSSEAAGS